tara:strand:+ start:2586 stop:3338 length:753 start_codon:yes stop_codon:yes gene_type:complete
MNRSHENEHLGFSDTPVLPDSGYTVHDGTRPQPKVVTPGSDGSPPADATVLFDGTSLESWEPVRENETGRWKILEDGSMEVVPSEGDIQTRKSFGDIQLHLEFRCPVKIKGNGQGRGNSGVFLMGRYEIQVLDNFQNPTYSDGTVGAIYGQTPPLANAVRQPGEWNLYEIFWEAPVFENGERIKAAKVTAILNGIVVQHATELQGPTINKALPPEEPQESTGPLRLQDHGDLVRFRNIWVRRLGQRDELF